MIKHRDKPEAMLWRVSSIWYQQQVGETPKYAIYGTTGIN